jgi:hypothetical protein
MTIYYKKIDLGIPFQDFDLSKLKGDKLFEYGNNIGYFKIVDDEYVNSIFGDLFKVPPVQTFLVQAKANLRAHRDNGVFSSLNYYIKPQGYVTNFWEPIENARRLKDKRFNSATNQFEEVILGYEKDDLKIVDSFTALKNEAYIFNNGAVHSVEGTRQQEPRTLLQFQWFVTIEELIEKLGV